MALVMGDGDACITGLLWFLEGGPTVVTTGATVATTGATALELEAAKGKGDLSLANTLIGAVFGMAFVV